MTTRTLTEILAWSKDLPPNHFKNMEEKAEKLHILERKVAAVGLTMEQFHDLWERKQKWIAENEPWRYGDGQINDILEWAKKTQGQTRKINDDQKPD